MYRLLFTNEILAWLAVVVDMNPAFLLARGRGHFRLRKRRGPITVETDYGHLGSQTMGA